MASSAPRARPTLKPLAVADLYVVAGLLKIIKDARLASGEKHQSSRLAPSTPRAAAAAPALLCLLAAAAEGTASGAWDGGGDEG